MTADARIICLCFLLGLAQPVIAQDLVGGGLAVIPEYPGARDYRILPAPIINYQRGPFFISNSQGLPGVGLKMRVATDLDVGVQLGVGLGRRESRSDRLAGLGDIDAHARYGAFVEWTPGRWNASASYIQAAKSGYGGALELRGSYAVLQQSGHSVRLGASTQWTNSDYMQTWFGVTPAQAAQSGVGLQTYQPSSGISSATAFALWSYRINTSWGVSGLVGVRTLTGDAADSPIVERKTSAFGSLGLTYAF